MIKRLIEQLSQSPVAVFGRMLRIDFRKCMLIIAGLNGVLMIIACSTVRCRLPPKAPPAWKSLLTPWKESRYVCLVAGSGLVILKQVFPYINSRAHSNFIQLGLPLLPRARLCLIEQRISHRSRLRRGLYPDWQFFWPYHFWSNRGPIRRLESFRRIRPPGLHLPLQFMDTYRFVRRTNRYRLDRLRVCKRSVGYACGSELCCDQSDQRGRNEARNALVICWISRIDWAGRMWR